MGERMLVSICILAWNEEKIIKETIRSLFEQSVFQECYKPADAIQWQLVVVPNGCHDQTATAAAEAITAIVRTKPHLAIHWDVRELKEPGKANAWNQCIHQFVDPDCDLVVMVDADIVFGHLETIENSIVALAKAPHADVAVDRALKNAVRKERLNTLEKISLSGTDLNASTRPGIAGSFYCARASALRNIWIPPGLPVEDGFIKAMIISDCFRKPNDDSKIVLAVNASHYFDTLTNFRDIFRHEVRMVVGTALNCYLTWDFLKYATDPRGPGAGYLIKNCIDNNPSWYQEFILNTIRNRGYWVLPNGMLFRRLKSLSFQRLGVIRALLHVPLAMLLFAFDFPVLFTANKKLRNGTAIGYWR